MITMANDVQLAYTYSQVSWHEAAQQNFALQMLAAPLRSTSLEAKVAMLCHLWCATG